MKTLNTGYLKSAFICLTAALCVAACSKQSLQDIVPEGDDGVHGVGEAGKVTMVAPPVRFVGETRSTMNVDEETGLTFTWSEGDKTGVYSSADGFSLFNVDSGIGTNNATFGGGGFSLTEGATYYAFFPYNGDATVKTAVPVDFSGQKMTENDDMASPMTKDFMAATAVCTGGNAQFHFKHLGSFVRTKLTMPAGVDPVVSVNIVPLYGEVVKTGKVDVTAASPVITTEATVSAVTVTSTGTGIPLPSDGGVLTLWSAMAPQDFSADSWAIVAQSNSGAIYSATVSGKNLLAGKAYKVEAAPVKDDTAPDHGFAVSVKEQKNWGTGVGEFSGITWLGGDGDNYAIVHDKEKGGGIMWLTIPIDRSTGVVGEVNPPTKAAGTESGSEGQDSEGIAYYNGKFYVSAEKDQSINEYDEEGYPTGNSFTIPADMKISGNMGFEALTFDSFKGLFWTTTEGPLPKDNFMPRIHRLQSFGTDGQPAKRYLYQMDAPNYPSDGATQYVHGISAMAALPDGRLIILEREVCVNVSKFTVGGNAKLYVVDPVHDNAGILCKRLLTTISTNALNLANYEGMCLGPTLSDGSRCIILISDTQANEHVNEYIQVVTIK